MPQQNDSNFREGDRVRLNFRGKSYEAIIKTIVDEKTFVVTAEDLLLPIACSETDLELIERA